MRDAFDLLRGNESEGDDSGDEGEGGAEGGGEGARRVRARLVGPRLLYIVGQRLGLPPLWYASPTELLSAWEQLRRTGAFDALSPGQLEELFEHVVRSPQLLPPSWAEAVAAQAVPAPAPGAAPEPSSATPGAEEEGPPRHVAEGAPGAPLLPGARAAAEGMLALFHPPPLLSCPPPPRRGPGTLIELALMLTSAPPPADHGDPIRLATWLSRLSLTPGPPSVAEVRVRVRGSR